MKVHKVVELVGLNNGVAGLRLFGGSLEVTFRCCSLDLSSLGFGSDVCSADVKLFWHILTWCRPWQLEHELVDLHFQLIWPLLRHMKHLPDSQSMVFLSSTEVTALQELE